MADQRRSEQSGERPPVPDPTLLTTQQLLRELLNLRELMQTKIDGNHSALLARFEGMDKAIELIQRSADKVPSEVDLKVTNLQSLANKDFINIAQQFSDRDRHADQLAALYRQAVDAALTAQKETAAKAEEGFTKLIDKLTELVSSQTDSLGKEFRALISGQDVKIDAVKERFAVGEGRVAGISQSWGVIVAAAGIVIGVVAVIIAVLH
jgi:hypothetical protein